MAFRGPERAIPVRPTRGVFHGRRAHRLREPFGSRFLASSSSETSHLTPLEGTSTLADQRMAFRTRVRNSGMPQFPWKWPPVKPKARPPS